MYVASIAALCEIGLAAVTTILNINFLAGPRPPIFAPRFAASLGLVGEAVIVSEALPARVPHPSRCTAPDTVTCYRDLILLIFLAFGRPHTVVQLTPQGLLTYKRASLRTEGTFTP